VAWDDALASASSRCASVRAAAPSFSVRSRAAEMIPSAADRAASRTLLDCSRAASSEGLGLLGGAGPLLVRLLVGQPQDLAEPLADLLVGRAGRGRLGASLGQVLADLRQRLQVLGRLRRRRLRLVLSRTHLVLQPGHVVLDLALVVAAHGDFEEALDRRVPRGRVGLVLGHFEVLPYSV